MREIFRFILALLVAAAALTAADHAVGGRIALENCPASCGDVSVPFPFGISPGCYLPGFNLTCDASHTPPRLLIGNGTLRVVEISIDNSTVRAHGPGIDMGVTLPVGPDVEASGTWGGNAWGLSDSDINLPLQFVLSAVHNEFVITGCGISAKLLSSESGRVMVSCSSDCSIFSDPNREGDFPLQASGRCKKCSGAMGCCQAPIPMGLVSYQVLLKDLTGIAGRDGYPRPYSVLIAEEGWFDGNITSHAMTKTNPVVLAWMIGYPKLMPRERREGNATCPSVCHSSYSYCTGGNYHTSGDTISGYTCKCWDGYEGNPYLSNGCQGLIIGLAAGSVGALLFLVLGNTFIIHKIKARRKEKKRQRFFKQNRGQLLQQLISQSADIAERMIITLEELEKATNYFDNARELGNGGHGTVYKGILSSLHVVAIKKSKIMVQREIDEFINEVAILSQINHRNIVKLHGCCLETEVPLLVYEFISNGTLYNHLHAETLVSVPWKDRLRIAVETSRAITYLHSFVSTPIIHRDIKSPNILLDDNLTVKLSDFGASRYIPIDQEGVHTTVQGTLGYLDPMYYSTGHLTEKSDVYSFGVLLIELLTRRKPVSYRSTQGYSLVKHFTTLVSESNLDQILDPQVTREGGGEVVDVALLAAICVKLVGDERPTMRQVGMALEAIHAAKEYVSSDVTDDESKEEDCIRVNDLPIGETTGMAARSWEPGTNCY
ncbi:hypothetical protein ACP70R_007312 [Stipagrostis hirtigluma subsp. patula]